MAKAFGLAVQAAEIALKAGPPSSRATASATSPMNIFK
jgi:thiazole synthase ThiGH ThiG subunit